MAKLNELTTKWADVVKTSDERVITGEMTDFVDVTKSVRYSTNLFDIDKYMDVSFVGWWDKKNGKAVKAKLDETFGYRCFDMPVTAGSNYVIWGAQSYPIYTYFIVDDDYNIIVDGKGWNKRISVGSKNNPPATSVVISVPETLPNGKGRLLISADSFKQMAEMSKTGYTYFIVINLGTTPKQFEIPGETVVKDYTYKGMEAVKTAIRPPEFDFENNIKLIKLTDHPVQMYWDEAIKNYDRSKYSVNVSGSYGHYVQTFKDYMKITPYTGGASDAMGLTATIYDNDNAVVTKKEFTYQCLNVPNSPAEEKTVLMFGDSLLNGGVWCNDVFRMLTTNDAGADCYPSGINLSNITSIGGYSSQYSKYENWGGWTFKSYNTNTNKAYWIACSHSLPANAIHNTMYKQTVEKSTYYWSVLDIEPDRIKVYCTTAGATLPGGDLTRHSGVGDTTISYTAENVTESAQNPFWDDETGKVDFAKYAEKYGKASIDYCYILLGWNSNAQPVESLKADIAETISNIHRSFPNCKITLIGLQHPSCDGFGSNYRQYDAVSKSYSSLVKYVDTYQKIIDEFARTTENVYSLPIKQFFDTAHSYGTTATKVNLRSTEKTNLQNNCMHPGEVGYLQIADRVFVDLVSKLS